MQFHTLIKIVLAPALFLYVEMFLKKIESKHFEHVGFLLQIAYGLILIIERRRAKFS